MPDDILINKKKRDNEKDSRPNLLYRYRDNKIDIWCYDDVESVILNSGDKRKYRRINIWCYNGNV